MELAGLSNLTQLRLDDNQLGGGIPVELAGLSNLTHLYLGNNRLTGEIPAELGELSNLQRLWLSGNRLTGEIPMELGGLSNLQRLFLTNNQLSGGIPAELGELSNLTQLFLTNNQLSGVIPVELAGLSNLTQLRLDNNQLGGVIPVELAGLSNLTQLRLGWNRLGGVIPVELAGLSNLTQLRLERNRLGGEIPPELGKLANLQRLWLSGNRLGGEIPPELGELSNLTQLQLDNNQLGGGIPVELAGLSNLTQLWLHDNQLIGEFPSELAGLANLTDLRLRGNRLSGGIPDSPVPVRVAPAPAALPSSAASPAVVLVEAFGGRRFEQPTEIGAYPVGPGGGAGAFVAEREGRILLLRVGSDEAVELLDIRDRVTMAGNEEGLLSVALDPRFEETGHLWVYYSVRVVPPVTRLSRFAVDPDDLLRVDPGSEFVVLEIEQPHLSHNGGAIRFGPDGMLYLGLGDGEGGGDPNGHGQNLETLLGSVIRIDVREVSAASPYAVPPDNPFVDVRGARPEIWAYGLRNPWRMAFDGATGALWAGDVGENEFEEIDLIKAGGNYGWNRFEGTRCFNPRAGCDPEGTILPVVEYGHHLGCSVTGGVVYRGAAIPALVGHYLFADVCRGQVWALPLDGGDVVEVAVSPRSVVSFGVDAEGEVYVLTHWGAVLRIEPQQS